MFGPNIVVSDGPLWRKFRRVAGPAFNEKNNELVWDETFKIVADLVEQDPHWRGKKTVHCGQVLDVTLEAGFFFLLESCATCFDVFPDCSQSVRVCRYVKGLHSCVHETNGLWKRLERRVTLFRVESLVVIEWPSSMP